MTEHNDGIAVNIDNGLNPIFEGEIIHSLMTNGSYFGASVPYLDKEYFADVGNNIIFDNIKNYYITTGYKPNIKDIILLVKDLPKAQRSVAADSLKSIMKSKIHADGELLLQKTESFIKIALHTKSLIMGAEAMASNDTQKLRDSFDVAEEAQKISLDENLGMDFNEIGMRVDYYQSDATGILPGIKSFDDVLGKGITPKTLTFFLAPPGIGKSASMVAFACEFAKQGLDVVICTLEMAEEEYFKRIDANLLSISTYDLEKMDPEIIKQKHKELYPNLGQIIVKEFPSYELTASKLSSFLEKVENKLGIKDPVTFVDYLQLMSSDRMKDSDNSYGYIKSITSELRAVAQKRNLRMFSASQLNRTATGNIEADSSNISDSMGIAQFADALIFILQTPQMKENKEVIIKFEKNRFSGKTYSFKIGFDYPYMKFIDKYHDSTILQDENGLALVEDYLDMG